MIMGLFPGNGKKDCYTCQPYVELLVGDLLTLNGTKMFDSFKSAPFTFKCELICFVWDYLGIGKVWIRSLQRVCTL